MKRTLVESKNKKEVELKKLQMQNEQKVQNIQFKVKENKEMQKDIKDIEKNLIE